MVEDDEQHGTTAKEDGQSVEVVVGYHFGGGGLLGLRVGSGGGARGKLFRSSASRNGVKAEGVLL